jgi:hypothetical protein
LLETNFIGVKLAHRDGQAVFREVVWLDAARLGD